MIQRFVGDHACCGAPGMWCCLQAHMASTLCMLIGVTFQSVAGAAMGASQGAITRIFTSDAEVGH